MADDLHQRIVDVVLRHLPRSMFAAADGRAFAARLADHVIAIRDSSPDYWRERAEKAEAGIARVRALHTSFSRRDGVPYCDHCSVSAGSPWRRYVLVPWPCETLAALDDTREDEDHG